MPQQDTPNPEISNPVQLFTGEQPRTTFDNMERTVHVELLHVSNPWPAMNEMVQATHSACVPELSEDPRVMATLKGAGMWMLQEIPQFIFKITGVSRIFTHQLVRQRVGITFMQQCTGDTDFRHCNIIVPGCIGAREFGGFSYACLIAKCEYARELDRGIPLQSARYVLPHAIETFIYAQASLATVVALFNKRCCTMTQTWETVLFARSLRQALYNTYPEFAALLEEPCIHDKCWFQKAKYAGTWTPCWQPDYIHDVFPWHASNFIYRGTNQDMSSPIEHSTPKTFLGMWEQK